MVERLYVRRVTARMATRENAAVKWRAEHGPIGEHGALVPRPAAEGHNTVSAPAPSPVVTVVWGTLKNTGHV